MTYQNRNQYNNRDNRQGQNRNTRIPNPDVPAFLAKNNYVETAEKVVLYLKGRNMEKRFTNSAGEMILRNDLQIKSQQFELTTTKIRNLLSLLNVIYQNVQTIGTDIKLGPDIIGKIQYFKMRCAYEAGRESAVADLVKKANIMKYIDNIGDEKENFITFFHYVEALVAYHRYYGGLEN